MFFLLMSASFIETGSDTYATNLAEHYAAWPEVASWLKDHWEAEELQHGQALRAYVEAVWPDFPWQQAYDSFFAEYSQLCTMEELYSDQRLEMVARCVVETGTTAYYHTLRELSDEPVLTQLLGHIRNDKKLPEAVCHQQPLMYYAPGCPAAQDLHNLASRLQRLRLGMADWLAPRKILQPLPDKH